VPDTSPPSAERSPFPGLRSFLTSESHFFFGRENHTDALLRRLARGRFLAVVGASGGGKSSLVRAGLLPALYRGYLTASTTRWRIAVMRPGGAPLAALSHALAAQARLGTEADCLRLLQGTTLGLVDVAEGNELAPGENLLVVVDQFEELFRYAGGDGDFEEPRQFVSLLLNAVDRAAPAVYVVLTMRYDYLADCGQFPGLPEALNASQYLIPRLTRDERRAAIERPLQLVGKRIAPRLVQALLNEAGDDPYQLPVLQHTLMRTYNCWLASGARGEMDLDSYEAAGRIAGALDKHANEIQDGLDAGSRRLVEPVFRCLTVTDEAGRCVRRPSRFDTLCRVVGADADPAGAGAVAAVVRAYADPSHSLLLLSAAKLEPATEIDISHESLIARWKRLEGWARAEARSAVWYRDVAKATLRRQSREAGWWRGPELKRVLDLRARERWNAAWAAQYWQPAVPPSFDETERFLRTSRRVQALLRGTIAVATALVMASVGFGYWQSVENRELTRANLQLTSEKQALVSQLADQTQQLASSAKAALDYAASARTPGARQYSAEEVKRLRDELEKAQAAVTIAQRAGPGVPPTADSGARPDHVATVEQQLSTAQADLKKVRAQVSDLQQELEKSKKDLATAEQSLSTVSRERDDWKLRAQAAVAEPPVERGATCRPTTKGEPTWADYFEEARTQAKASRLGAAAACYRAAIALKTGSEADARLGMSEVRIDYFPYYELADVYARQGESLAARVEVEREEAQGAIRRSKDFAKRLEALKAQLPSAAGRSK
jgi:energy-coupling factor transporter ATP-binding protein EcfA2